RAGLQLLLRRTLRAFGAGDIDFFRLLGGFGEGSDFFRQHLGESPGHGEVLFLPGGAGSDLRPTELGDERRVARGGAGISHLAGDFDGLRRFFHDKLFGSNNFELEGVSHNQSLVVGRWPSAVPWIGEPLTTNDRRLLLYAAVAALIFSAFSSTWSMVPTM